MRFDDSLKTVLAADASTDFGARIAFRQLVDLTARGRIALDDDILARLAALRRNVPVETRAAVARGLALAHAPRSLVGFFAADAEPVASAALRAVRLSDDDWTLLLSDIGPTGRAVLRAREDLSDTVRRALQSFGATDFALSYDAPAVAVAASTPIDRPATPPVGPSPFVSLAAIADTLPIVAEARRRAAEPPEQPTSPRFEIAELVDRIAAFQRTRDGIVLNRAPEDAPDDRDRPATDFAFETDAGGTIRWTDTRPRGAVIGRSIARVASDGTAHVDGVAAGAFRRRTGFADARLDIGGGSVLAGDWRISGVPLFDPATGRFIGFRGRARRPRVDEDAGGLRTAPNSASEGLRRLVHELRTPTNAIAGFSELIETQLLGPVGDVYRARAATIRAHAADLVAAIDDLDMAARIEGDALEPRAGTIALAPILHTISADLAPLAALRGCRIALEPVAADLVLACDDRIAERLLARLCAALVSAGSEGERIAITAVADGGSATVTFTRPHALVAVPEAALLSLDAEREAELPGAPLLGTGFALRLARNLATELGGSLSIGATRLTLTLPAAFIGDMGRASTI